jgi:UDP-3-O-[3-hydroxymyristoyl] N-acetylglucosamine deacetylase/3-hydroxyacyl-[acyl-carrier-protein] dehydratase
VPDSGFKITCTSADKGGRFTQFYTTEITPQSWERELAHARTFCFYEEIEYLIKNGLIKGGSLETAVVIREDAVLTTEPLRYNNEFVRHKMLDIVGDLALVGKAFRGHLIAVKPSHAGNCELARHLRAQMDKPLRTAQTFAPPPPPPKPADEPAQPAEIPPSGVGAMGIEAIMKLLPHRHPFLLVDRVLSIEGNKCVALKNVSVSESYFPGHFPGHPIMPGVLQLEAIAQVAGIFMIRAQEKEDMMAYFMAANNVKWRKPVVPGDTVIIEVEMMKSRGKIGKANGVCKVNGEIVSEAEVTFMVQKA